jgi:chromosome segregation ATPase
VSLMHPLSHKDHDASDLRRRLATRTTERDNFKTHVDRLVRQIGRERTRAVNCQANLSEEIRGMREAVVALLDQLDAVKADAAASEAERVQWKSRWAELGWRKDAVEKEADSLATRLQESQAANKALNDEVARLVAGAKVTDLGSDA